MRKLVIAATLAVAVVFAPTASATPRPDPADCAKTFTVKMGTRAIYAVYAGTRVPTRRETRMLNRIIRCQRNPNARPYLRGVRSRTIRRWTLRRDPPMSPALASWYDDAGTTGCGFHTTYGIATDIVPCGGHVLIQGPGGTVDAVRDDSPGPAVAAGGRTFDLNASTKAATGCSDLCEVHYRVP